MWVHGYEWRSGRLEIGQDGRSQPDLGKVSGKINLAYRGAAVLYLTNVIKRVKHSAATG